MTDQSNLAKWEKRSEWPLAIIAILFLIGFSIQVIAKPQGRARELLEAGISVAWVVFVVDYLVRLTLAGGRARWFFRHLPDLAIVLLPFLRPLRLLRLVVLFGALQRVIGGAFRGKVIVYTIFSVTLLIYVASLAILDAEQSLPDAEITNLGDAVWWSITTITTVGYGDFSPVTGTGRVIAVLLMIGGISLVGVVTATLASWVIQRVAEEDAASRAVTAVEIDSVRSDLANRIDELAAEVRQLREPPMRGLEKG